MRQHTVTLQSLLAVTVLALPELTLQKKSFAELGPLVPESLLKRAVGGSGTLQTVPYSVLTWSTGGAYYANGKNLSLSSRSHHEPANILSCK